MVVFICAFCGKHFKRCPSSVKDPKRAFCNRKCSHDFTAEALDESFANDPMYLVDGRDSKEVLREGLMNSIDSGLVREILRGRVPKAKNVVTPYREHVKGGQ